MRSRAFRHRFVTTSLTLLCLLTNGIVLAQAPQTPPPPPPVNQSDDPLLRNFRWRSIGPASMGGRVDDIAVVESNPFTYYVGFATAGVWKTTNNGTTFTPIFDTYATASVGDIALSQSDPNILWVGTGENNNRQSSSFGDGIYKSTDAGNTFTNMGLKESQTISRIVIDPKDNNTVYVAALGHLFGANAERGLYKTIDGGRTWANIKSIDNDTGFTDVAIDHSDNKTLYAASYQRRRTPWGFNGGGQGSALWKTTDAGKSWNKLQGSGLPNGTLGRIGVEVSRSNPNVVYAQIEVGTSPGTGAGGGQGQGGQGGQGGQAQPSTANHERSGVWRSDDKGKTWRIMSNNNNRPMYYSQIRIDPKNDQIIYTCGAPLHKSTDGGKTFRILQGVSHSDHHALWINPNNNNHIMLGHDGGLNVSHDQGETWDNIDTMALSQFYAVAVDMRKPYYIYGGLQDNGSWGGPSATRNSAGITNADWYRVGGGDGFYVQIDPTDHNTVYYESQNGRVQRLDLKTGRNVPIWPRSARPRPAGNPEQGPPQPQQFGFFGPPTSNIVPEPPVGEQYRFNWNTPIHISPHNPRILYVGANKLFKSVDRGDTWTASPDLSKQIDRNQLSIMGVRGDQAMASKNDGVSNYGNITTVAESPVLPGVIWVGTDDGNLQLSRDGGASWTNVAKNIQITPNTHQISRVVPSRFDAATSYVTIDGHRSDDHKPYVFVTRDYGQTWASIANNLPVGNVNVIHEDPKSRNLLYLGTEYALFISLDSGKEWKRFMTGLPTIRVDDILVHPRDNDLIVGTHGRGIYVIDDITALQQLSDKVMAADVHLFNVRPGTQWLQDATVGRYAGGQKRFVGENPQPGTAISYHVKSAPSDDVKIIISDINGKVIRTLTGTKNPGINRVQWDLRGEPPVRPAGTPQGGGGGGFRPQGPQVEPGTYFAKMTVAGKELTTQIVVEEDVWFNK